MLGTSGLQSTFSPDWFGGENMNSTGKKCRGSRYITGRCSDSEDVRLIPRGSMKVTPLKTSDSLYCAFLSSTR